MRLSIHLLLILSALLSANSKAVSDLSAAKTVAQQRLADYGNARDFFPTLPFKEDDAALTHEFVLAFEQPSETYQSCFLVFSSNITFRSGNYHINDCRACGVKLSIFEFREIAGETQWSLEMEDIGFAETGSHGKLGKGTLSTLRTGRNRYSILLQNGSTMGGGAWSLARLYTRVGTSFREVFTTHTIYDFPINMDLENERDAWKTSLKMDAAQDKEYFDIVLGIDETQYTDTNTNGKADIIKYHATCQHRYAFNGEEYEPANFEKPGDSLAESYPCSWKSKREKYRALNTGDF